MLPLEPPLLSGLVPVIFQKINTPITATMTPLMPNLLTTIIKMRAPPPPRPQVKYQFGEFFDGNIETIETKFGWRPSKHFRTSLAYIVSEVELPQGDFTTRLARASFDIVFSNTLSWVNLVQYDNVSESIGLNSRLHWVPQSGRNVFLVLNHNYRERLSDMDFHSVSTDLTLKADYTFRF